ncbi:MAG: hypothetical protein H0T73_05985, partial [Ardenticatenales bacterium]|nr:hypothetical protein [Ardenticatenales bacterium]
MRYATTFLLWLGMALLALTVGLSLRWSAPVSFGFSNRMQIVTSTVVPTRTPTPLPSTVSWFTVDGGSVTQAQSRTYQVSGTVGQPEAGTANSSGYEVTGGFWPAVNAVGVNELTPNSGGSEVGLITTFVLTWTHPVRWRALETLELRLRDAQGVALWVRFTEGVTSTGSMTSTLGYFSLLDEMGQVVASGLPGQPLVLETESAALHLAESTVSGTGAEGPAVTVGFTVSFKPPANNRRYI